MESQTTPLAFDASVGIFFGLAVASAVTRTVARLYRFKKLYLEDYILLLALATLIAGIAVSWLAIPFVHQAGQIYSGAEAPPPDFFQRLSANDRLQYAGSSLLQATICAVKFFFLTFFYKIINRTRRWYKYWWWTVFALVAGSSPVLLLSSVIGCPYTDERVLTLCVSNSALRRVAVEVRVTIALDIFTDLLVISIPVIVLWNVQMGIRRKLSLAGTLCLSIFMIVCALVRIAGGASAQSDVTWLILWVAIEACLGVITGSITAFRVLFAGQESSGHEQGMSPSPNGAGGRPAVAGRAVGTNDSVIMPYAFRIFTRTGAKDDGSENRESKSGTKVDTTSIRTRDHELDDIESRDSSTAPIDRVSDPHHEV